MQGARRVASLLCAALCSWPLSVRAASPSPAGGQDEAAALTRLFAQSCLRHAGDPSALRRMLSAPPYRPATDAMAAQLLPRPGRAYQAGGGTGHLVVLSFDDGWCGAGGMDIDPHALTLDLAGATRAGGASMRLMGAEGDGREQRYLLTRPPPASPIVLLVLLRSAQAPHAAGAGLMQANLFAAPMPAEPTPVPP